MHLVTTKYINAFTPLEKRLLKDIITYMFEITGKIKLIIHRFFRFIQVRIIFLFFSKYTIVWIYPHIGDTFYGLPYLQSYKDRYNVKICLIGNTKYRDLYDSFGVVDKYILTSEEHIMNLCYSNQSKSTKKLIIRKIIKGRFLTGDMSIMSILHDSSKCKTMQEFTRKYIYGLDDNAIPRYPIVPTKIITNKPYIIISPYAKSISPVPIWFFEKLVEKLSLKYIVYTNVGKNEEEIQGTLKLDCNLFDLASYSKGAVAFIGLRSGACDLVGAMSSVKMFVLFNNGGYNGYSSIKDYRKEKDNVYEFYGVDYEKYKRIIIKDLV